MSDDTTIVVDLFCGAGGFSTGAALALEELGQTPGEDVELHAVNHWDVAIETHERNHPWAEHYHCGIEEVDKSEIAEPGEVDLLIGGPECTHFSTARGGKPVDDQKRMPAWNVLNWIHKLRPKHILLENVGDLRNWGPIEEDGTPSRDGSVYSAWIEAIEAHGYPVIRDEKDRPGIKLTAADYGDPTTRERLFVVASRTRQASVPEPTHSDADDELEDWVPAAEVIDWDDLGTSLWTRDLENPRFQPLSDTTMGRIAEGIRRHCDDRLEPLADELATIDPERLEELRETVIPLEHAEVVAEALDEPFLVECPASSGLALPAPYLLPQGQGGRPRSVQRPSPTVQCDGAISLSAPEPFVLPRNGAHGGDYSNGAYLPEDSPMHVVTAKNHDGWLVTPQPTFLTSGYFERSNQAPRTRSLDRPLMTVPASRSPAATVTPYLVDYHGQSTVAPIDAPMGTVETRDRYALCVPEAYPWGLDVQFRMLQPRELKQAQGFPEDYEIAGGTKADVTEQIGNAVPVGMATALCKHQLSEADPSLSTFGGGMPDEDAEVPEYSEVASDD